MAQTVLVVDDDPLTQRVLQHYLERGGFQMISAGTGREAIKLATTRLPQLMILYVMMPDLDGWEVLRQVKSHGTTKAIPVILLSGNADLMAKEETLHSGASAVLVKPINPEQLLAVIRHLLPASGSDGQPAKVPQ